MTAETKRKKKMYAGAWKVTFSCGQIAMYQSALESDIKDTASKSHQCRYIEAGRKCQPTEYTALR